MNSANDQHLWKGVQTIILFLNLSEWKAEVENEERKAGQEN